MNGKTVVLAVVVALLLGGPVWATTVNVRMARHVPPAGGIGGPSPASTIPPPPSAEITTDPQSPPATPEVDAAVAVQRATAYVVGLHSFDYRTPYPGWEPSDFRSDGAWILGGELLDDQRRREANITDPTAGDQRTYQLMADRQQVTTVMVTDTVPVIRSGTEVLVNLTWHTEGSNVDRKDVVGANQFTVITMHLSPDGQWLAVSDVMPQAT